MTGKPQKKYQTEQRKRMIALFEASAHRAMSAQDVALLLKDDNISMSAIYRNLGDMEKSGLICKISENNKPYTLYQYLNHSDCSGIVHLKCQSCDETYHLDKTVSDMIFAMAQSHFHFSISNAMPILYGYCEQCSLRRKNL